MTKPRHHPFPSNGILSIAILEILAPGYPNGLPFFAQNILYHYSGGTAWCRIRQKQFLHSIPKHSRTSRNEGLGSQGNLGTSHEAERTMRRRRKWHAAAIQPHDLQPHWLAKIPKTEIQTLPLQYSQPGPNFSLLTFHVESPNNRGLGSLLLEILCFVWVSQILSDSPKQWFHSPQHLNKKMETGSSPLWLNSAIMNCITRLQYSC